MESTTAEKTSLTRELAIAASPETVWQFLIDPEKSLRWWGQTAMFDTRPGGEYRIQVIPGHAASGAFVEVDPPRRLVYTWGWEQTGDEPSPVPPGSSTVEIDLIPTAEGTTLRFLHRDLPGEESVASHSHGWDHYLERLAIAAPGGDPGPDPWITGDM
jgi:uncharacterized protein YndB with AHSA1/START domain